MERKDFLKGAVVASLATALDFSGLNKVLASNKTVTQSDAQNNLVAVMGGEPVEMFEKMLAEMGGIKKFVSAGDRVVIKPNIGWAKTPDMGANTNPDLVGALVKQCVDAGAKDVRVFDHTCNEWTSCYDLSGIKSAVEANGGIMLPGNDESYYVDVELPEGVKMKKAKIHKALEECDVWFNVPILKVHGGAKMTISMKNYMGIVWDRTYLHETDLQQCIADACTYHKKPALHIVDAYRVMKANGPRGKSIEDVVVTKGLFASSDPVAVDVAALKFFAQVKEMNLSDVAHIELGEKLNLGTTDLTKVNIKRIKI
ncbi:MAG: DUF362 domain-containing protein [Rikenellaceae bacterium]